LWDGVAARIADGQPREKSHGVASLFGRMRAWLASALVAPRFSPALTAALMLVAIGATATAMRYMNPQPVAPSGLAAGGVRPTVSATPLGVVRQPAPEATPRVAPVAAQVSESSAGANALPDERRKNRKPEPRRRRDSQTESAAPSVDPAQILAASQNNEIIRRHRATERLVREAEAKYLAAIRMLSEDVNRKRTRLDPQIAARFDETLAAIDRSIAETRRTVLRQSNDPVAVQYMLSAYAKKVEVMREMAALD
jgi:hypothetical protein